MKPILNLCAAVLALGLPTAPALAQDEETYRLPEGCEAYVTVQYKLCQVSHHYTCVGDPEGHQWRVDLGPEGETYLGRIDAETQWIESFDMLLGIRDTLDADPTDPASFTELTQTGRDDFDFSTSSAMADGVVYRGRDLLTGRTVVIDDVPLLETETYAYAETKSGEFLWESTGNEYIHLEWRLFMAGRYVTRTPNGTDQVEDAPEDFIFPGEAGFLSPTPEFNCNTLIL
ncbi:MAG: hypothetical protein AAFO93_00605 [Pseudomonadota bacterium]